ncbi:unnamed protein product, partial [Effrenium voratum]
GSVHLNVIFLAPWVLNLKYLAKEFDMGGGGKDKGKGKGSSNRKPRGGRGGTHPWINSQIIQASESKDVGHLMNVIMQHLPQMNLVNLSTAIHRVAKIAGTDPWQQGQLRRNANLEALLNSVCTALNVVEATEVQPQSVSNVVWSLATLRIVHRPLLQVISLVCVSNMAQFKSFELSTTLWALAKLGSLEDAAPVDKAVFYAAATHIHNNVNEFGFRCLATTAWAFATARQRHARLFRSMAAAMLPAAAGANCQEMANTAWAFGTADFHDDALFHELAEQAMHRLEEFKPQEISNMLWGFATNSFFHEAFYARASQVAQKMDLQSQHLANILWAFARVRPKHPLTLQTVLSLLPLCTQQLQTFKPQEVSSTLLATAKAVGNADDMAPMSATLDNFRQEVLDFFHACLPWVVARLRDFSEQSLANSVSAYAMVPVRGSDTLVDCAGKEVLKRHKDLDVNALVHLLKGFTLVPTSNSSVQVVKALAEGVSAQLDRVRAQEMQSLGRLLNRGGQPRELDREEIRARLVALAQSVQLNVATDSFQKVPAAPLPQAMPLPMQQMQQAPMVDPIELQAAAAVSPTMAQGQMGMQEIFPQARRQQLSQIRTRQRVAQEEKFLQHPLCPISESNQLMAERQAENPDLSVMDIHKMQSKLLERKGVPQDATGFRMEQSAPLDASKLLEASRQAYPQPCMLPTPAGLTGPYHDPMVLMPTTSLAPEMEQARDAAPQMLPGQDGGMHRGRRNNWETQRTLFVKNSFLHVEDSDDDEDDVNCDGNSSHRSSSMPSSMGRDYEDRPWNRLPSADMLELLYSMRNKAATPAEAAQTGPAVCAG